MSLLDKASLIVTPNAYKESKLYSVVPNTTLGDMDVVRATTATRVNSAGLIEEVPRNLLTYSNTFSNAAWFKNSCSISANSIISPDGIQNASKLVEGTANDSHHIYQNLISSGQNTFTFYAKQGERKFVYAYSESAGQGKCFDLENGTLGVNIIAAPLNSSITSVGNGWYRCSITISITTTALRIGACSANGTFSYLGNGTSGIYIYGAQLDKFATATEYFPTTTRLNIPRIDYTNGSCPSLLVEPQRTNVLIQSNNFVSNWGNDGTSLVVNNFSISPDGTQNAARVTCIPTTGYSYRILPIIPVGKYTFSIYIKASTSTNINFGINDTGGSGANQINVSLTTNWKRFEITQNITLGTFVVIDYSALQLGINYDFYGAQVEAGSYPTSYIPTVASTVTRNADVISKTGISSLIGQTEGTLFCQIKNIADDNVEKHITLSDGTNNNIVDLYYGFWGAGSIYCGVKVAGTTQGGLLVGALTVTNMNKIAVVYKTNRFELWINGSKIAEDLVGTTFSGTTLSKLETAQNGANTFFGNINSIQLYKTALSSTELAQLTTL